MKPYFETMLGRLYQGDVLDVLKRLPDESVDCIVTSPPYWALRDYGVKGQFGLEPTLELYLEHMLQVTAELYRVLKRTGVCFWNHGDCYGGSGAGTWKNPPDKIKSKEVYHMPYDSNPKVRRQRKKAKCLCLQNYRLILHMIDEQGWILRNVVIWHKPNHMPSSVKDRFASAYEPVFMLVKQRKYWFDLDAVRISTKLPKDYYSECKSLKKNRLDGNKYEKKWNNPFGKNPGDLWTIPTQPFSEAHFATFPLALVERCIKAGCPAEVCVKCGKARKRITKPTEEYAKRLGKSWHNHTKDGVKGAGQKCDGGATASYYTIGWTDCGCGAKFEPGIVLDPFMGSGTTAIMAEKLGRQWIGIELNPEYCKMIEKRLSKYKANLFSVIGGHR